MGLICSLISVCAVSEHGHPSPPKKTKTKNGNDTKGHKYRQMVSPLFLDATNSGFESDGILCCIVVCKGSLCQTGKVGMGWDIEKHYSETYGKTILRFVCFLRFRYNVWGIFGVSIVPKWPIKLPGPTAILFR